MAEFATGNIRNIALMGHGSEGKTTLTEAMLFAAGMIDRQGKVEDGSTVSDFDPEEKKRGFSISASYAFPSAPAMLPSRGAARLST